MEKKCIDINEVGIDEAGRGTLIGRVYAGAVILNQNITIPVKLIKDSKKLSPKKRAEALEWIKESLIWGVGYAEPEEIDKINILNATKLAMDRAIEDLKKKTQLYGNNIIKDLIIDGIGWENTTKWNFNDYNVKSIVKGDSKYYSIAAASIVAKEYHDQHIRELYSNDNKLDSMYDLSNNMGYATKKHILGIEKYGNSIYHRKTFKPCCNTTKQQ